MINLERSKRAADQDKSNQTSLTGGITIFWGIAFSILLTAVIYFTEPLLPEIEFLPDQGASWYYWQLPAPTFWSRFTAWSGYTLHQLAVWWLIYKGQKQKLGYSNGLKPINIAALAVNGLFVILHLVQTQIWFDGLAQDVSIWSSQWSVIIMLVFVLHMENNRRGLFFGKRVKWNFLQESGRIVRKYHGYIFAWGIIYTFWYHPMVATAGHLLGFFYTFLLLLQGSLMFTRAHINKWWTVTLEIFVLIHGTIVALLQGQELWPMFFFGFLGIFIITQMYGLGLRPWMRWAFIAAYISSVAIVYAQRGWVYINEIIRIPLIEYLVVFIFAFLIWGTTGLVSKLGRVFRRRNLTASV